jgi:hypothetical protein
MQHGEVCSDVSTGTALAEDVGSLEVPEGRLGIASRLVYPTPAHFVLKGGTEPRIHR